MAITRELQKKGLAEYVVHHVLHVEYPFQDLDGDFDIYADVGIEVNFFHDHQYFTHLSRIVG
jgi:hypothetical protein